MSATDSSAVQFTSHHIDQTVRAGVRLGDLLLSGDVICLSGTLGAGKTAFTRGIATGWRAREAVTSPTFTLIHEHRRNEDAAVLYHVDCYRLAGAPDAWGIGLEDLLYGDGIVVIEWPEHIAAVLPEDRLWIAFTQPGEDERQLAMTASGDRYRALLAELRPRLRSE